jgi:hypothetical protein
MIKNKPDYDELRIRVLDWLETLKVVGREFDYRFSLTSGYSLFTTCFALFILDLFRQTDTFSKTEKKNWAAYINSHQKEEDGLFYPNPILHPDKERAVFQASCFCLSALSILDEKPNYRLSVVDRWKSAEAVKTYLIEREAHLGKGGSGNKAMFQAIFLTHEYEKTRDVALRNAIEAWFCFHERYQNRIGFWEKGALYAGLQNGFHQYMIYEYWNREFPKLDKVIKIAINLQNYEGFFAPYLGGSACYDQDALHVILSSPEIIKKRKIPVEFFEKTINGINKCWNSDGGFCENAIKPYNLHHTSYIVTHIFDGKGIFLKFERMKAHIKEVIRKKKYHERKWVNEGQLWDESTLWDTWFRSLSLVEVGFLMDKKVKNNFRFHKHIGIGFKKS